MSDSPFFLAAILVIYILAGRFAMRCWRGAPREIMMVLLNLAGVYLVWFRGLHDYDHQEHVGAKVFAEYVVMVVFQYAILRAWAASDKVWLTWLAFGSPIVFLVLIRYVPGPDWETLVSLIHGLTRHYIAVVPQFLGISYLAFRCSRLVLEVRNGSAKIPGIAEYLGFAFFLPTMSLGPINTYANHRRGFADGPWEVPVSRAALRVLVGLVKYQFIGGICNQLTYAGLLLNGHPHRWIELPVAMVFYFLYLYCNFSGFCDMAIGAAALIGIPVLENFNNPFASRNIKEFWNRWHITLSQWMRDIVFAPLSKFLVRVMGPVMVNHAIAVAILVVFLLIGVWHGVGWNYAIFGLLQALGVIANHYYTIGLKKWLGRDGFKSYMENRWIHALAVAATFFFYAATLLFFANTIPQIKEIIRILR